MTIVSKRHDKPRIKDHSRTSTAQTTEYELGYMECNISTIKMSYNIVHQKKKKKLQQTVHSYRRLGNDRKRRGNEAREDTVVLVGLGKLKPETENAGGNVMRKTRLG